MSRILNRLGDTGALFTGHFIEVKAFYVFTFHRVACVSFIGELDMSQALAHLRDTCRKDIRNIYQHCYYDHDSAGMFFNSSIFVLKRTRMIELADGWCQVLHSPQQHGWANELVAGLARCRVQTKAEEPRVVGFMRQSEMN